MALWTVKRQGSSAAKTVVFRTYAGLLLAYALTFFLYSITSNGGLETRKDGGGVVGERLRAPRESTELEEAANETVSTEHSAEMQSNCSRPSVENFPQGVFSMDTLRHGALAVDVVAVVYMFGALAIVCDSYFMPALEIICSVLHLSEDVAGATFMAIGGSAPELFTSIVGVFISKGDIGIGTILGSAVFNVLFVIGLCGLLAGKTIYLTCWPLTRDSCCYIMSILALVFVVSDGVVTWAESAAMLVLYCMYIVLMYFNPPTERYVDRNMAKCRCRRLVIGESGRAGGEGRGAANLTELANLMEEGEESDEEDEEEVLHIANGNGNIRRVDKEKTETARPDQEESPAKHEEDPKSPFEVPKGCLQTFSWCLTLPALLLFYVTIPDCRKKAWARWYPLTFLLALVWIGGLTYLLVWMVTVIGFALRIPDTVMGLTLLAAGSSVPDLILSVIAAREGYGDMAISHSIGSNLFDILLGLGLPWFLSSVAVQSGRSVAIHSGGVVYITALLLGNVVAMVLLIRLSGFLLNKKLGLLLILLYAAFLVLSVFLEMSAVLGVNELPVCGM
ncbi:sodium/potassium/calcium exchanger 3-like isoform X1 [Acanthaster planci]|uniref:Sodium/potassium/calcium exchanger 3-like isoform X1 n=1 Tax=Acanthaster planci TaxID=133434 RepID=A0A8B7ZTH9_ACAPL|nr:sodium/potassium/calcium exchanger 3-like isoform X1 [Acanthaster planci]